MSKEKKYTINDLRKDLVEIEFEPNDAGMKSSKQRKKDKAALRLAKEVEKTKEDFVWMQKDKTSKLVDPKNVKRNLLDGWRKLNLKRTKTKPQIRKAKY